MKQKIINVEQSEYWNKKSGPKWVKNEDALNERLSILTNELFSRANIKESDKVLDIGCGGGDTTFRVSRLLGDGGHVVGADISHTLLNHAKSKFSNNNSMKFMHCDAQNYSFDKNRIALLGQWIPNFIIPMHQFTIKKNKIKQKVLQLISGNEFPAIV